MVELPTKTQLELGPDEQILWSGRPSLSKLWLVTALFVAAGLVLSVFLAYSVCFSFDPKYLMVNVLRVLMRPETFGVIVVGGLYLLMQYRIWDEARFVISNKSVYFVLKTPFREKPGTIKSPLILVCQTYKQLEGQLWSRVQPGLTMPKLGFFGLSSADEKQVQGILGGVAPQPPNSLPDISRPVSSRKEYTIRDARLMIIFSITCAVVGLAFACVSLIGAEPIWQTALWLVMTSLTVYIFASLPASVSISDDGITFRSVCLAPRFVRWSQFEEIAPKTIEGRYEVMYHWLVKWDGGKALLPMQTEHLEDLIQVIKSRSPKIAAKIGTQLEQ